MNAFEIDVFSEVLIGSLISLSLLLTNSARASRWGTKATDDIVDKSEVGCEERYCPLFVSIFLFIYGCNGIELFVKRH